MQAPDLPTPSDLANDLLVAVLEGLLFAADRALSVDELREAVGVDGLARRAVLLALGRLAERHGDGPGRGFVLVESGDRWQFRTTGRVTGPVARLTGQRPVRLSRAALETLAIVAYKQPCTRGEIERVRGVDSGGVLRALLERRLLRLAGRRDEPGRPMVYATTREFLEAFGLGALTELPSLREFTQLGDEDLDAAQDLMAGEEAQQVTFSEYAARQVLGTLDEAVEKKLGGPTPGDL